MGPSLNIGMTVFSLIVHNLSCGYSLVLNNFTFIVESYIFFFFSFYLALVLIIAISLLLLLFFFINFWHVTHLSEEFSTQCI